MPLKRSRRWVWVLLAATGLLLAIVLGSGFLSPWSEINCWHEEIELHSGRIRKTWYLCFVPVSVQLEESAFSRAIDSPLPVDADWHRVNTFSPGVGHSPHYIYHGAISEIELVEEIWERGRFTPEARRQSAEQILLLWRTGGLETSREYVHSVADIGLMNYDLNCNTEANELPQP
jgi:hypothetical protein